MKRSYFIQFLIISGLTLLSFATLAGKWPGNAVVGNGKFCAVYSEDPRVIKDGKRGIRHLYMNDFKADYIQAAYFQLMNQTALKHQDSIVPFMGDFFTPSAHHFWRNKLVYTSSVRATDEGLLIRFETAKGTGVIIADFIISPNTSEDFMFMGYAVRRFIQDTAKENYKQRPEPIVSLNWKSDKFLSVSASELPLNTTVYNSAIMKFRVEEDEPLTILLSEKGLSIDLVSTLWEKSEQQWKDWISIGGLPYENPAGEQQTLYNEYYCRNLYAAYSSTLHGQVPADVTGQFLTNGMPQLYPRDAMMTASNFLKAGFPDITFEILRFWADTAIPHKSPGEFYARYDAFGKATDSGSGARYDEPEWDAGAYFIILNYEFHAKTGKWLFPLDSFYPFADFIAGAIDSTGLLYEGGIVEWTGYLPATNMICASALMKASEIARQDGRQELAEKYDAASKIIQASLPKLFDNNRRLYTARRYTGIKADNNFSLADKKGDLLYLWDITSVFGILWGYPDHPMMHETYQYVKENLNDNGGVRYFEATDKGWLEAYGRDLFYFATAAWSKYAVMQKDYDFAKKNLDWIINQSNIYGLMPERVISDYSNISEASPLTWGCAEFAGAVKRFAQE
ncbi:MAG TPA: hypothetical protein VK212_07480 [Lentimicrobium sp.]|nr:hypothetical protein [Lentimicrobium sp.]